jgi:hypothetical protein
MDLMCRCSFRRSVFVLLVCCKLRDLVPLLLLLRLRELLLLLLCSGRLISG